MVESAVYFSNNGTFLTKLIDLLLIVSNGDVCDFDSEGNFCFCPEGAFCVGRVKKIDVRASVRPSGVRPDSVTLDLPEISKFVAK